MALKFQPRSTSYCLLQVNRQIVVPCALNFFLKLLRVFTKLNLLIWFAYYNFFFTCMALCVAKRVLCCYCDVTVINVDQTYFRRLTYSSYSLCTAHSAHNSARTGRPLSLIITLIIIVYIHAQAHPHNGIYTRTWKGLAGTRQPFSRIRLVSIFVCDPPLLISNFHRDVSPSLTSFFFSFILLFLFSFSCEIKIRCKGRRELRAGQIFEKGSRPTNRAIIEKAQREKKIRAKEMMCSQRRLKVKNGAKTKISKCA